MKEKPPTKTRKTTTDLIKHLEVIAKAAAKCEGNIPKAHVPKASLIPALKFLGLNKTQSILFAIIFILSFNVIRVDINDIANYVNSNNLSIIKYYRDLEIIAKKKLIKEDRSRSSGLFASSQESLNDISYVITRNVLEAILTNNKKLITKIGKMDTIKLLEYIYKLVEEREGGDITTDELCEEAEVLFKSNIHLSIVRKTGNLRLNTDLQILFLHICRETINGRETVDLSNLCEMIYDDASKRFRIRRELIKGNSELIKQNLIKIEDGIFKNDRDVSLTEKAIHQFFDEELDIITTLNKKNRFLITPGSLKPRELFFNPKEHEQLSTLTRTLKPNNFVKVRERLKECKMREGLAVLLHGPPGTGKTASVFEIARITGRDVMLVDISDTKSMWFGESEKKIKQLFDQYRTAVENEKIEPILLFNEIDAVFSTRKKVGSSPVDQTENAIQNIILQELEDLNGILIGTTNLTKNLDPAFERRFLFKINFNYPDADVRTKIWKTKIPHLTNSEASVLGEKYLFSGGNIENIARKTIMHEVIHGVKPVIKNIESHCNEELLINSDKKPVGYTTN